MRKKLDYLIIPDSRRKILKERKKKAFAELHKREIEEILIVKGKDSEEDILYLGKILKKGERIAIDTFPLHFKEYKDIIEKAKRERKFPKGIKIEHLYTEQPPKLFIYGILGWLDEKFKRKIEYKKNKEKKFLEKIKEAVKNFLTK
ncbi:MAG: hypothetical protein AABW50_04060 [Nanoarchaeota archaeon]